MKIRVPTQVCPFYFRLKSRVPTRASYRIQHLCWTDRFFEDSSFSKLGFSILSLLLKIWVPTRVFNFYFRLKSRVSIRPCFSKLGFSILSLFLKIRVPTRVFPFYFRLKSRVPTRAPYRIQRSCWNRRFFEDSSFSKLRLFHFIIIFQDPGSDSGFPFLFCVWSLGFRLELPIGFNVRVETDRFFEDSSFSKLGFSILSLFLKIRVSTRVFSFYFRLNVSGSDSSLLSDSTLVLKPIVSLKIRVFQNSGFPFYHYFEDPGSDSGFPFLILFEVSGSDSSFLSDTTLVLKLIVSLKIRVFQNCGFPFYHYFWRSGFRLGFSLFIFVWSLGFRLELPIGFNARVETDRFFEDSSFSKLGFSILSLFLKIRVPTRVFPFYFRLKSWVPTRASYRIQRSCWNRSFLWRFEFFKTRVFHFIIIFEDPGSDSGFPFLFSFEVSGSDSSFLSDSTLVLKPIVSLKIRVFQYSGFPFYHYFWRSGFRLGFSLFIFVWSLGFWLELPIGFNARAENDRFFDNSSFSKLGFFILLLFFKIWVLTRVFPFYFRLKSRVPTRASYRIQPSCWNRSFLWRFECFKTQVFHFIIIFEDPGSDSGFPFLFSFEVSGSDSSFLSDSTLVLKPIVSLNIRVFQNSGFPFYHYFWRSGFRPGFSLFIFAWSLGFWLKLPIGFNTRVETDRFFEDSSFSKLGFSILSLVLKIRVPTRVFPFYFRLKSRVPSRYCFSKLGFSILSLFFKIRVPTRVFPFYFRLKSRVLTRASYRIQRSCWNRSFLWRFEFFKT